MLHNLIRASVEMLYYKSIAFAASLHAELPVITAISVGQQSVVSFVLHACTFFCAWLISALLSLRTDLSAQDDAAGYLRGRDTQRPGCPPGRKGWSGHLS